MDKTPNEILNAALEAMDEVGEAIGAEEIEVTYYQQKTLEAAREVLRSLEEDYLEF